MKHSITSLIFVISCSALTQCTTIENLRNKLPGGPSVTQNTDAPLYFEDRVKQGNLNSIAAKVDDSIVTSNEFNFIFSPVSQQIAAQFPRRGTEYNREFSKAKNQILDQLIERELIMNEFSDLGAQIPPRAVDQEVQNRINTIYNGKRSLYLADLRKNGLSQSKYRDLVERSMIVGAMKAEHNNDSAPPTTAELNKEKTKPLTKKSGYHTTLANSE